MERSHIKDFATVKKEPAPWARLQPLYELDGETRYGWALIVEFSTDWMEFSLKNEDMASTNCVFHLELADDQAEQLSELLKIEKPLADSDGLDTEAE